MSAVFTAACVQLGAVILSAEGQAEAKVPCATDTWGLEYVKVGLSVNQKQITAERTDLWLPAVFALFPNSRIMVCYGLYLMNMHFCWLLGFSQVGFTGKRFEWHSGLGNSVPAEFDSRASSGESPQSGLRDMHWVLSCSLVITAKFWWNWLFARLRLWPNALGNLIHL